MILFCTIKSLSSISERQSRLTLYAKLFWVLHSFKFAAVDQRANLYTKFNHPYLVVKILNAQYLTLPIPIPAEEKKFLQIYIFTLRCGATKGVMKASGLHKKPSEV